MARLLGGIWEHKKKEPVALSVAEEIQALGVLFVGGGVLLPLNQKEYFAPALRP